MKPAGLRSEYLVDPLGIDTPRPRLSWIVEATRRDARGLSQSAYHVLVASDRAKLGGFEVGSGTYRFAGPAAR